MAVTVGIVNCTSNPQRVQNERCASALQVVEAPEWVDQAKESSQSTRVPATTKHQQACDVRSRPLALHVATALLTCAIAPSTRACRSCWMAVRA